MATAHHRGERLDLELVDVTEVDVRIVGGEVTVTAGGEGTSSVRLEIDVLRGSAADVDVSDGVLSVEHQPVRSLGGLLSGMVSGRAIVSLIVPERTDVRVRTVSADVFVAGVRARTALATVSGGITATALDGDIGLRSVSGDVVVQGVAGNVRSNVVSGDVTISGGVPVEVTVRAVSGEVILALDEAADVECTSVSGDVAVRLPADADFDLDVRTVSGRIESEYPDPLDVAKRRLWGRIGRGGRRVAVRTTSGDVTVLRRAAAPSADAIDA